jgi:hypothetical protein
MYCLDQSFTYTHSDYPNTGKPCSPIPWLKLRRLSLPRFPSILHPACRQYLQFTWSKGLRRSRSGQRVRRQHFRPPSKWRRLSLPKRFRIQHHAGAKTLTPTRNPSSPQTHPTTYITSKTIDRRAIWQILVCQGRDREPLEDPVSLQFPDGKVQQSTGSKCDQALHRSSSQTRPPSAFDPSQRKVHSNPHH